MDNTDETRHAPDGHVRDHSDEDENEDVTENNVLHDSDSDETPQLAELDTGRDTLLIVDGEAVAGEFVAVAAPNEPNVPLAAIRVAPPRAGELRLHHLTARYGLAVGNLSLAQTQRVIFERRIRDLEYLELRRSTRERDHIIARELRYTENEAQIWRILRRPTGTQRKAAIAALLDLKLECTVDTPPLRGPRGTTTYPPFEWVPTGTVGTLHPFRRDLNSARFLRWRILSIERELIGSTAGPVPVPEHSIDIREAIAEVTRCNHLHVENIRAWEVERAHLRHQLRDTNRDISVYYNSLYGCPWDPIHFVTEVP